MSTPPRVSLIDPQNADGILKLYFNSVEKFLNRIPNTRRAGAHSPMIAMLMLPFTAALQREGAGGVLSSKIKEMAIIKTSHLNGCKYWFAHNTSLGEAAGISEEQVQVIGSDEFMDSAILNTREKAAILWAKHVTKNTARSRDDIFKIISESFTEPEIVELTLIISYFNMNNRFVDSLHIPLEPLEHVNKIKGSVKVNPEKIRQYLENILENWPDNFPEPNPD